MNLAYTSKLSTNDNQMGPPATTENNVVIDPLHSHIFGGEEFSPDDDQKLEDSLHEGLNGTSFLQLPSLNRKKIYTFLSQNDHLNIRFVCSELLEEVDNFVGFSVVMKYPGRCSISIPFPYLKLLTIDNDQKDLPWNIVDLPVPTKDDNNNEICSEKESSTMQTRWGSVESVDLGSVTFQTFLQLSRYRTIKSATLTTNVFVRPVPSLMWTHLKILRVKFHILCHQIESFMLDNFDSLCVQHFPNLETLSIAMCNTVYPNIQSAYSIRILRFVTKHWRSLRSLFVMMEAECCVAHHYVGPHICPGLSDLDSADMKKVQLTSLTFNATELTCPRCSIWQEFIRQQTKLQALEISISCAMRLSSDFFCPVNLNATQFLNSIIVTMWGMDGYFPFDFRHLHDATNLRNLEIVRHSQARSQMSRPELLNISSLPLGLISLTLNGFLILSDDVPILFKRTCSMRNLILIDCGFGLDIGVLMEHITLLSQHPSYATAIIDFNTPVICPHEAVAMLSEEMDKQQLIFQYLFEIPTNKNHRFWFVHPDRVDETNLEKTGYSKDVLLNCDVLSEYTQNSYFDHEFEYPDEDNEAEMNLALEPLPTNFINPSYVHRDHNEILVTDEFQQEVIPTA